MNPSSMLKNMRYHMPKIRGFDSAVGAGLGALGGLGVAGIRDAMSDDEEKDNARYWTHGLGGAAAGFGLGNLVGDRTRRYMANNVTPYGYEGLHGGQQDTAALAKELGMDGTNQTDFLKPRSWAHFYRTAIQDRPAMETMKFMTDERGADRSPFNAHARYELLRRHMGLPMREGDAMFRSTGERWFQPTVSHTGDVVSGGIPGNYEHVEFDPQAWNKLRGAGHQGKGDNVGIDRDAYLKALEQGKPMLDAVAQHGGSYERGPAGFNYGFSNLGNWMEPEKIPKTTEKTVFPSVDERYWKSGPFWNKTYGTRQVPGTEPTTVSETSMVPNPKRKNLKEDSFGGMFARHGTQLDVPNERARVFDHWDFGLQPLENALLKEYMQSAMTGGDLSETVPYDVRTSWNDQQIADWFGGRKGTPDPTKRDHMIGLLKRVILNDIVGRGGVVFDQEFDLSDRANPKPIFFNPNQTDVGLRYLNERNGSPGG